MALMSICDVGQIEIWPASALPDMPKKARCNQYPSGGLEGGGTTKTLQPNARHHWLQQERRDDQAYNYEDLASSELAATAHLHAVVTSGG